MSVSRTAALTMAAVIATAAGAQQPALPPIRPLGPITRAAADSFRQVDQVRALSDGRLLVHDGYGDRVVLFDSTLQHAKALIDTTGETERRYPTKSTGGLFAYIGDTSIFVDPEAVAFLVIDPTGRIVRVVSPPTPSTGDFAPFSRVCVDAAGRFIFSRRMTPLPAAPSASGAAASPILRDSQLVLRVDPISRRLDTLAYIRTAKSYPARVVDSAGFSWRVPIVDPMPIADGWACFPDGAVAAVRAQDFHVDWFASDGGRTPSPQLPHQWNRLSDSAKAAITDSLGQYLALHPIGATRPRRPDDGVTISHQTLGQALDPDELPDYVAPFSLVRPDADGNLWIQETLSTPGSNPRAPFVADNGGIFDLVNRAGVMVDRVQIPGGTFIVGFGPRVVYLISETGAGYELARARIR